MVRYTFTFQAVAAPGAFPPGFVQRRQPGHPLVGDSPIRAEFPAGPDGTEEYVTAWHQWVRRTHAYEREERLYGEEARIALRTKLELRAPEGIPYFEEAGLI